MARYTLGDIFIGDYPVSQYYDENPQNYPMFADPGHEGVDFKTPNGTPIIAPFDGIILRDAFSGKDYGNYLVLWDPIQLCAVWFCHLRDTPVAPGDAVVRGQIIAYSNNTGNSTGPHLHVNFVETSPNGIRSNLGNGKQGFLDILDKNLVKWDLSGNLPPDDMPKYFTDLLHEKSLDINNESLMRAIIDGGLKFPQLENDLKNAREELEKTTSELMNAVSANKQQASMIGSLIDQVSMLEKEVIELKKQLNNVPTPPETPPNTDDNMIGGLLRRLIEWVTGVVRAPLGKKPSV